MTPKEHAIQLLSQGISTAQVAAAVGCDDSYISQLKADPEVQQQIAEVLAAHSVADIRFDDTLERAELLALEKIEKSLPFANMSQALGAFRVLNGARKRKDGSNGGNSDGVTINVSLTLPATALPRYVTNAKSEIIEVEGRTMVSATPTSLDAILAARASSPVALPGVTSVERAAAMLGALAVLPQHKPRKSPLAISPDLL